MPRLMITPQNFWLFFGGVWLFVGLIFLIVGVANSVYGTPESDNGGPLVPYIFGGLGILLTAVGGTLVIKALKKRKLEEALRRSGMPAEATITEVSPSNFRINRVQQWAVHYQYQDAYGNTHISSRLISPGEASQWQVGQNVAVKYDSMRPKLHVWIGQSS